MLLRPRRGALLLIIVGLWWTLSPCQCLKDKGEPCVFKETQPEGYCVPCEKSLWPDLIKQRAIDEKITNKTKTCFNDDPLNVHYEDKSSPGVADHVTLISVGDFKKAEDLSRQGFVIRKEPFFRYAYDLQPPGNEPRPPRLAPPAPPVPSKHHLDPTDVKKYFNRGGEQNADFQLLEWPGKDRKNHLKSLENEGNNKLPAECHLIQHRSKPECKQYSYRMLIFERDNGKILNYDCNAQEGSNVVALGTISQMSVEDKRKFDPHNDAYQKVWVSHGTKSLFKDYVQPLYLSERILAEMQNRETGDSASPFCRLDEVDCETKWTGAESIFCTRRFKTLQDEGRRASGTGASSSFSNYRTQPPLNTYTFGDLRTVHDFSFTRKRLILAMECGIIVVSGILTDKLEFKVSTLRSETGISKHFPAAVTKLASSTCCSSNDDCGRGYGIVAAYSYLPQRSGQYAKEKFLYVSFDHGSTFEKKFIAKPSSPLTPLTLVKGLYKLYEKWHDYYEILNNPDEEDLKADDDFMKNLRSKPIWAASTTEQKEELLALGYADKDKPYMKLKKIMEILEVRAPKRRARVSEQGENANHCPSWACEDYDNWRYSKGWGKNWTDENCALIRNCRRNFETDNILSKLLTDDLRGWIPRDEQTESNCREIVSILMLPEERDIMAVCWVGNEILDGQGIIDRYQSPFVSYNDLSRVQGGKFAIFHYDLAENVPMSIGERASKRIFNCDFITNSIVDRTAPILIMPEAVRMQGSSVVFITNCRGVLYMTTNFGVTVFNSAFHYELESVRKYCDSSVGAVYDHSDIASSCPESAAAAANADSVAGENGTKTDGQRYVRSFKLCALNVPSMITTDAPGTTVLMTFGKFYARGVISYNTDQRLVVGEMKHDVSYYKTFDNLVFPYVTTTGTAQLAVALKLLYSLPNTTFQRKLFDKKHALRLVPLPYEFYRDASPFHLENLAICKSAELKNDGISKCQTNSFSVYPKNLHMDILQTKSVTVKVKDDNPYLPLWISSSNEESVGVTATLKDQATQLSLHEWKLDVTARPNKKPELTILIEAFFGYDYNKLYEFSTQISLINSPNMRCHVPPSTTVNVEIGCQGKKLVAHEDSYRPQCKLFRKNFNYTLKRGTYDPELAKIWLEADSKQVRPFFRLLDNGDLSVTYDYSRWGCPLEPFRTDNFIPDLRIVDEGNYNNTAQGVRFTGKFILIELFGATGFSYSQKVGQSNCRRKPQNLKQQIKAWKIRQRVFYLASHRLRFPTLNTSKRESNISDLVSGNPMFQNEAVKKHINIWNRANYQDCEKSPELTSDELTDEIREQEYEVMITRRIGTSTVDEDSVLEELDDNAFTEENDDSVSNNLNEIVWHKDHQRVYVFLAVAVDNDGTLCNLQTVFGVSLSVTPDMDDFTSFMVFFCGVLLWMILVVGGYHCRKRHLQATYIEQARSHKLEQAAWKVVYQYEKLIHGKAVDSILEGNLEDESGASKASVASRSARDKRKADLRMKKSHIMAQEQARHEKLQKTFQKQ